MRKIQKRLITFGIFTLFFTAVLMARLAQIQLFETESFSTKNINLIEESVKQRTQQVVIDDGRGYFLDRNGRPLGEHYIPTIVLFPFLKDYKFPIEQLLKIIPNSSEKLEQLLLSAKKPIILNQDIGIYVQDEMINQINQLNIPGVFGVYMKTKSQEPIASHLIGLTSADNRLIKKLYPEKDPLPYYTTIGVTGLERAFDEFLLPEKETKLMYHVDGLGRPLFGVQVKYMAGSSPFYPVSVQTTIDAEIQKMAEKILEKHKLKKGGLILLDIERNEVLALVSKPDLNRNDKSTFYNYMFEPMFPGSVFKTVIAAAAIEKNSVLPNRTFNCDLDLYGKKEKDPIKRYGMLTFTESFAKSCNYAFAALGQELMAKNDQVFEEYAEKLGLINLVGWKGQVYHYEEFQQIPEEHYGKIWGDEKDKRITKAIVQTSIGQKNVSITPLAVVNMMATIARGGEKREVKVASKILYKNGTTMFQFDDHRLQGDTISPYTAQKLQRLLREVVAHNEGTGRRFNSLPFEVAGKSGTAETGKDNEKGEKLYHKWFAGYFPFQNPQYALVVVDMDTTSEAAVTNDVFYDFAKSLYQHINKR